MRENSNRIEIDFRLFFLPDFADVVVGIFVAVNAFVVKFDGKLAIYWCTTTLLLLGCKYVNDGRF